MDQTGNVTRLLVVKAGAYLQLTGQLDKDWQSRSHFFAMPRN